MAFISNLISNLWIPSLGEREGSVDSIPAIQSAPPNPSSLPKSLDVSVIELGRLSWQGSAQSVTLSSPSGEFGILAGHYSLTMFLIDKHRICHTEIGLI